MAQPLLAWLWLNLDSKSIKFPTTKIKMGPKEYLDWKLIATICVVHIAQYATSDPTFLNIPDFTTGRVTIEKKFLASFLESF